MLPLFCGHIYPDYCVVKIYLEGIIIKVLNSVSLWKPLHLIFYFYFGVFVQALKDIVHYKFTQQTKGLHLLDFVEIERMNSQCTDNLIELFNADKEKI